MSQKKKATYKKIQFNPQLVQNGPKWTEMDQKRPNFDQNGPKLTDWTKMNRIDQSRPK